MLAVESKPLGLIIFGVIMAAVLVVAHSQGVEVVGLSASSIDTIALFVIQAGAVSGGIFTFLHIGASVFSIGYRWVYGLIGIVAALSGYFAFVSAEQIATYIAEGQFLVAMAIPAFMGMIGGFSYHTYAGYSSKGDDPTILLETINDAERVGIRPDSEGVLRRSPTGQMVPLEPIKAEGLAMSQNSPHQIRNSKERMGLAGDGKDKQRFATTDLAHVGTDTAEYFDGPLQVRTSHTAMLMASFFGILLVHLGSLLMALYKGVSPSGMADKSSEAAHPFSSQSQDGMVMDFLQSGPLAETLPMLAEAGLSSVGMMILWAVLMTVPMWGLVYVCHLIARNRGYTSYGRYFLVGLVAPPILGLLLLAIFLPVGLKAAAPCAFAMLIYRKSAGLEPASFKEDIIVSDRRTLVGENHARRRFGRVIAQ